MSIILRIRNSSTGAIEEYFVGFIAVTETTGEYLANSKLQELERIGLNIQICRRQGYDNDANMVVAFDTLRAFCPRIQEFRDTGFEKSAANARLFVEKSAYEIESQFKDKRKAQKKRMFGYEHMDEPVQEDLLKLCNNLGIILQEDENSDIDPFELYEELQILKFTFLENINDVKQLIQHILENNFEEIYPKLYMAIRIMLTIPVSTASSKRNLSKLKLIMIYLRSTMSQERLSALSILSIEVEIAAGVMTQF
ncbi:uncharacterized protein LOC136087927 [Hydra vulgaris]|uniref:Uncharacterized protein LOC136087927 n=1 Tax=Hydra vulgaris TaxID=6087 RepID=A0ABM4D061_HYDVU